MADAIVPPPRRSRFWLFAPFVILVLVAVAWTAAWMVIRNRAEGAVDAWLAREAANGRQWLCADRKLGGYPFRIELSCASLGLQRPDFQVALGRVLAVAQVYQPRHVIVQAAGPLRASDGRMTVEGTWTLLEASLRAASGGLQRASVVAEAPSFRLTGLPIGDTAVSARRLETHLRPSPGRDGAYDWTLNTAGAVVPALDPVLGGSEPVDLDTQITVTQARDVRARPLAQELERWRHAGGEVEVTRLALAKGPRRLAGSGRFGLDEAHRVQGRLEVSAAGIEGLIGSVAGQAGGLGGLAGGLAGAILGAPPKAPATLNQNPGSAPELKPLPPLRLDNGRLLLGPFPVPGIRLTPLY